MSHTYNITSDGVAAEAKIYANMIRQVGFHRGNLLNVIEGKEYDVSGMADSELTPDKFPFMGRKLGKINVTEGHTTSLGMRETADGKWCYIQPDDYTLQVADGEDADGNVIYKDILVEYSKIVEGYSWDSSSETEPEWMVYEEE